MTQAYRPLTAEEIGVLVSQGCTCDDWSGVEVADGFWPERVRQTQFAGRVRLGRNDGHLAAEPGIDKPCGVYHAVLCDCTVGDGVRIANVGVHIANYDIGPGACIENVGLLQTRPGACFGNGVTIEPVNEGGGRELILFDRLDSQFAHLMCMHRYRPRLVERLRAIALAEASRARSDRGTIGAAARVRNVKKIIDVQLGPAAVVDGATSLVNGSVLSSADAPTTVGADVLAEDFIIAEGSEVDGGAVIRKSYVGQGCRIGRQFSCEGSAFFANCEGFHGEACSIFAGPYTVTHHKSTLLIAGYFSFYNAGSGTNQSNHLYKLGPLHEGKLERGCKTGSFSYLMWPCRVGPFSVVLGKHTRAFDAADFPFSYIEATAAGHTLITPGFNLTTVGTVRDGAKWPARDRRKGALRRDRISFDVLSPLTVGRMMRGSQRLKEIQEATDRSVETVIVSGADMKRLLLRTAQKTYRTGIHLFLLDRVVARIEAAAEAGAATTADAVRVSPQAVFSQQWVDIGGQMLPRQRIDDLCAALEADERADLDALNGPLDRASAAYKEDEWAWVCWAYEQVFEAKLEDLRGGDLARLADDLAATQGKFLALVLADAAKEFDETVRIGFGQDGEADDVAADFTAVRGEYETNSFVRQMKAEIASLTERVARFKQITENF